MGKYGYEDIMEKGIKSFKTFFSISVKVFKISFALTTIKQGLGILKTCSWKKNGSLAEEARSMKMYSFRYNILYISFDKIQRLEYFSVFQRISQQNVDQ